MLKVIFDTNVYGLLLKEKDIDQISVKIAKDKEFKVYGFDIIRKELRNTPKTAMIGNRKLRILLLNLYDEITKTDYLKNSIKIDNLAKKFYDKYRKLGGIRDWNKTNIDIDFKIVACAMFKGLDIVISDDSKTMLSKEALKSYKQVAFKENLREPNYWKYSQLKSKYGI